MSAGEMRRAGEMSETDSAEGVKEKTEGALGVISHWQDADKLGDHMKTWDPNLATMSDRDRKDKTWSTDTDLSMRIASVFRSFSSQVSLSSAMIFSDS